MIEAVIEKCRREVGIPSKEDSGWLNQPIRLYKKLLICAKSCENLIGLG